ncbi:uncharacterized protein METZ01_LOCUS414822, partial [marine metagenome]
FAPADSKINALSLVLSGQRRVVRTEPQSALMIPVPWPYGRISTVSLFLIRATVF